MKTERLYKAEAKAWTAVTRAYTREEARRQAGDKMLPPVAPVKKLGDDIPVMNGDWFHFEVRELSEKEVNDLELSLENMTETTVVLREDKSISKFIK